jgi:hypothetical protein
MGTCFNCLRTADTAQNWPQQIGGVCDVVIHWPDQTLITLGIMQGEFLDA